MATMVLSQDLQMRVAKETGRPAPDSSNVVAYQRWLMDLRKENPGLFEAVSTELSDLMQGN